MSNNDFIILQQHLTVSQTVFKIAKSFVSLDGYEKVIDQALEQLGQATNAARSYLFLFDRDKKVMNNTHEWCREGVIPEIDNLRDLPLDMFPWWLKRLSNGEVIDIEDVDSIEEEGHAEKQILKQQDIKSVLVLPVEIDGVLIGFVGLDDVKTSRFWDAQTKNYLKVASDMIGMAVRKHEAEEQIHAQKGELEQAYENLKAKEMQLIHSEKLAGIGQLAAGIAHEINNPVGYVSSNTDTLRSYVRAIKKVMNLYRKDAGREEICALEKELKLGFILQDIDMLLDDNLEGLSRIADIVKNLREFARIDKKEKYAAADINAGLHSALLIARNEIKYFADVKTDFGGLPPVVCDIGEVNQVFLNILVNAAQAIQSQARNEKGLIEVSTRCDDTHVICVISDDGPGIVEQNIRKIFDPFFTTKAVGKGTGLGLSISYDIIVNRHGGKLHVENRKTAGATFRIVLPIKNNKLIYEQENLIC
ncbi:MAG: sensor histidine kinase [Chitinivibrionales bacterium]